MANGTARRELAFMARQHVTMLVARPGRRHGDKHFAANRVKSVGNSQPQAGIHQARLYSSVLRLLLAN